MSNTVLGTGTFSQIFMATDKFSNQNVALKVMEKCYNILAEREKIFLDYFSSPTTMASNYCECDTTITDLVYFCIVQS